MRFLIIDDDDYKIEKIDTNLMPNDSIVIRKSYHSGLRELVTNRADYDYLILDMNFPHFDNGIVQCNEGLKVLSEIKRKKIDIPIIIYSSERVDVSEYSNVKDYLIFNATLSMQHWRRIIEEVEQ